MHLSQFNIASLYATRSRTIAYLTTKSIRCYARQSKNKNATQTQQNELDPSKLNSTIFKPLSNDEKNESFKKYLQMLQSGDKQALKNEGFQYKKGLGYMKKWLHPQYKEIYEEIKDDVESDDEDVDLEDIIRDGDDFLRTGRNIGGRLSPPPRAGDNARTFLDPDALGYFQQDKLEKQNQQSNAKKDLEEKRLKAQKDRNTTFEELMQQKRNKKNKQQMNKILEDSITEGMENASNLDTLTSQLEPPTIHGPDPIYNSETAKRYDINNEFVRTYANFIAETGFPPALKLLLPLHPDKQYCLQQELDNELVAMWNLIHHDSPQVRKVKQVMEKKRRLIEKATSKATAQDYYKMLLLNGLMNADFQDITPEEYWPELKLFHSFGMTPSGRIDRLKVRGVKEGASSIAVSNLLIPKDEHTAELEKEQMDLMNLPSDTVELIHSFNTLQHDAEEESEELKRKYPNAAVRRRFQQLQNKFDMPKEEMEHLQKESQKSKDQKIQQQIADYRRLAYSELASKILRKPVDDITKLKGRDAERFTRVYEVLQQKGHMDIIENMTKEYGDRLRDPSKSNQIEKEARQMESELMMEQWERMGFTFDDENQVGQPDNLQSNHLDDFISPSIQELYESEKEQFFKEKFPDLVENGITVDQYEYGLDRMVDEEFRSNPNFARLSKLYQESQDQISMNIIQKDLPNLVSTVHDMTRNMSEQDRRDLFDKTVGRVYTPEPSQEQVDTAVKEMLEKQGVFDMSEEDRKVVVDQFNEGLKVKRQDKASEELLATMMGLKNN